jgi:hypothetical protein
VSRSLSEIARFPLSTGGMRSSASSACTRSSTRLASGSPATIAKPDLRAAVAPSNVSRRSFAWRLPASGPWHAKQRSERIGRTSRSKLGIAAGSGAASPPVPVRPAHRP